MSNKYSVNSSVLLRRLLTEVECEVSMKFNKIGCNMQPPTIHLLAFALLAFLELLLLASLLVARLLLYVCSIIPYKRYVKEKGRKGLSLKNKKEA